ncbi:MAG: hypothetical protein M3Z22_07850 [Verrucomicrobiota bacterium]|nr:hypothetical protein [Verrucomicrobiota bacterium]
MAETGMHISDREKAPELAREKLEKPAVTSPEEKRPWYRQVPSLPSLLALLLSISTAIYSGIQGHKQDVQKKQESLRGIIAGMIELQGEFQSKLNSADAQKLTTREREFLGGMLNSKRMLLGEAADNLVRDIPKAVSSSEYNILANDKLSNGGAATAELYFRGAVAVSQDPLTKMIALRSLAMFYAQQGPFQSIGTARKDFQDATECIAGEPRDDATAYTLGFTWEMWGTAEYTNGFPEEAQRKIANARKYYGDMSQGNPLRNWALVFLDTRIQNFTPALPVDNAAPEASPGRVPPAPNQAPLLPMPSQFPGLTQPRATEADPARSP